VIYAFAAIDEKLLYAAPSHLVCINSGYRPYLNVAAPELDEGHARKRDHLHIRDALHRPELLKSIHTHTAGEMST
jgi:hypothetical protein